MSPYASVVICSMDEPASVLKCLEGQTFKNYEVILAKEKGITKAMNAALDRARGEIFVRIDDDVELPETWLEELMRPFADPQVAGTTGPTFIPRHLRRNRDSIRYAEKPGRFLSWLYDGNEFKPAGIRKCGCVSYDSNYFERFEKYSDGALVPYIFECDHLEGTNWAMRTELLHVIGGFDEKFDGVCEWFDTDAEQKIKKRGYKLVYNTTAYLWHLVDIGPQFNERHEWFGRVKNFLRYHARHSKFHPKMAVYLAVWVGYFLKKELAWRR